MIKASLFDKFFEHYKEDQGLMIAVGIDPTSEEVPERLARAWFEERRHHINVKLQNSLDGSELRIYRCMEVDEDWLMRIISGDQIRVGDHWTIDKHLAPFLKGGYGNKSNSSHVIIEARMRGEDINLLDLFQASYADDYEEYEVMPEVPVELIRLWDGTLSKVLFEFEPGHFTAT